MKSLAPKSRGVVVTAVVACALGWAARSVFSEDAPPAPAPDAMMAEMMKLAQPGPEHERLVKAFVGTWDCHGKFYMGPTPAESDSVATFEAFLDGRFVRQHVKGTAPWGPFEGAGLVGYNNGTKQFTTAWVDNMGTGIMTGTGVEKEPGTFWEHTSTYDAGPMKMTMRDETRFSGPDEFTMKMFWVEGGQEKLGMELTYKRRACPAPASPTTPSPTK